MIDTSASNSRRFVALPPAALDHLAAGRIEHTDLAILAALSEMRDFATDLVSAGQRLICDRASICDTRTVGKALARLEAAGLLRCVVQPSPAMRGVPGKRAVWLVVFDEPAATIASDERRRTDYGAVKNPPPDTAPEPIQRVSSIQFDDDREREENENRKPGPVSDLTAMTDALIEALNRRHEVKTNPAAVRLANELVGRFGQDAVREAFGTANVRNAIRPVSYASEILTRGHAKRAKPVAVTEAAVVRIAGVSQADAKRERQQADQLAKDKAEAVRIVAALDVPERNRLKALVVSNMPAGERDFFSRREPTSPPLAMEIAKLVNPAYAISATAR